MSTGNSPIVSCILPFFNAEKHLSYTLLSIEEIHYSNIELILINNGSTDKSLLVVKNFLQNSFLKENYKIINNNKIMVFLTQEMSD